MRELTISSDVELDELCEVLERHKGQVAVDTETVGVNPREQSPSVHGRMFCMSVAYRTGDFVSGVFVPGPAMSSFGAKCLDRLTPWLEGDHPKVTHSGPEFDWQIFANHGVFLNGILFDCKYGSRMLHSTSMVDHGLKGLAKRLCGLEWGEFDKLFRRPAQLGVIEEPKTRVSYRKVGDQKRVRTLVEAGKHYKFSHKKTELIPLTEIPEQYPNLMPVLINYACMDAVATLLVAEKLQAMLCRAAYKRGTLQDVSDRVWVPALHEIARMERRGIRLDETKCQQKAISAAKDSQRNRELAFSLLPSPVNFASSPQMQHLLYGTGTAEIAGNTVTGLGLEVPKVCGSKEDAVKGVRKGDKPTDYVALLALGRHYPEHEPLLEAIRAHRKAEKKAQYLRSYPEFVHTDNRIHCKQQPGTDSGRLNPSKPNLTQVPQRDDPYNIRECFVPEEGNLFTVHDESQLELRIMAHMLIVLYGDTALADDLAAGDVHSATARRCWPHLKDVEDLKQNPDTKKFRGYAKTINYAVNYGMSLAGLALNLGVSEKEAALIMEAYFGAYPSIQSWKKDTAEFAAETGWVSTLLGRRRPLPDAALTEPALLWRKRAAARRAANHPIQGTGADIMYSAMVGIGSDKRLQELSCRMVLQVHDELVCEVPKEHAEEAAEIVRHYMEKPPGIQLEVPLVVDGGVVRNWGEGH